MVGNRAQMTEGLVDTRGGMDVAQLSMAEADVRLYYSDTGTPGPGGTLLPHGRSCRTFLL